MKYLRLKHLYDIMFDLKLKIYMISILLMYNQKLYFVDHIVTIHIVIFRSKHKVNQLCFKMVNVTQLSLNSL